MRAIRREGLAMIRLELSYRGILTLIGVLAGVWLLAKLWPVMLLVLVAAMFAASLMPFVDWIERSGANRAVGVLVVVALTFVGMALIALVLTPVVMDQGRAIADHLPEWRDRIARILEQRGLEDAAQQVRSYSPSTLVRPGEIASTASTVIGVFTTTITLLGLTAYIIYDAHRIERFIYFSTPQRQHIHIQHLLGALQRIVGGYIRGQLITSALIAGFTAAFLTVLGVPNPLAFGVLAGVTDMIPVVGVILSIVPATIAAASAGLPKAVIVIVVLILYQEFENRYVVPKVYGTTLRLPAVAVFLALLVGAELLGWVGALISLPAAAAIRVFVEYGYDVRRGRVGAIVASHDQLFAPDDDPAHPRAAAREAG